jgi:hypothetical protein
MLIAVCRVVVAHAIPKGGFEMTLVDIAYGYGAQPTERQMRAIDNARDVYGVRRIAFNDKERTLRVEYDASHLSESAVLGLLRDAGIDLREKCLLT